MNRPIDLILPLLKEVAAGPNGKDWQALCPAHEDEGPSLSVTVGDDDRVLLHCNAGCTFESIVSNLGLQQSDLLPNPNDPDKPDSGAVLQEFQAVPDTPLPLPEAGPPQASGRKKQKESDDDKKSPVQILIELATNNCEFLHTSQNEAFAVMKVKGHRETWAVSSRGFEQWLRMTYYRVRQGAPSQEQFHAALNVIAAKAIFDGPEEEVFIRVANCGDVIYLDLCDAEWRAVKITTEGWDVVENPPVRFRRSNSMEPLPVPVRGGSVAELRRLLNITDDDNWVLVLGFLVQALRGKGPFLTLILQGEQGTAKTTTLVMIRALIDPAKEPRQSPPKDACDLMIRAKNSWVVSLDNLSGISGWLSDALCRLSTGGGLATRTYYTNSEETLFEAMRPAILNGIDEIAQRHDLLDRAVIIRLDPISDEARKTEDELWEEFNQLRPGILGALLDGVSAALRNKRHVHLPKKSRMADVVVWVTAAEPGLKQKPKSFLRAYNAFLCGVVQRSLDDDPVAVALEKFMEGRESWKGRATDLLVELNAIADDNVRNSREWPKLPNKLSGRITRLATFLRKVGIDVQKGKTDSRFVEITRIKVAPVVPGTNLGDCTDDSTGASSAQAESTNPEPTGNVLDPPRPTVPTIQTVSQEGL